MEFREVSPLPQRCQECEEIKKSGGNVDDACYNCDYALDRFEIIPQDSKS